MSFQHLNDFAQKALSTGKRLTISGWGQTESFSKNGKFMGLNTLQITSFLAQDGSITFTDTNGQVHTGFFTATKHGSDQVREGDRAWAFDDITLDDVNLVCN